ncbi:MAG TPA: hypothetical protein VGH95_02955 [Candidatus Aquirickettsiella sp.]|jgi:hypothetical protein
MSLLTAFKKFLINKNTSDYIKKRDVISSKRISEINFWEVYNEANEQYNKTIQQTKLMSKSEKVLELSEEENLNENHEPISFSEDNEKSIKIKSYFLLCTLFSFNEKKYKNGDGVRNSSDEFMLEDFKYFKTYS